MRDSAMFLLKKHFFCFKNDSYLSNEQCSGAMVDMAYERIKWGRKNVKRN